MLQVTTCCKYCHSEAVALVTTLLDIQVKKNNWCVINSSAFFAIDLYFNII